ncbi:MAG: hypothetical protein ABW185_22615, partial [Sedimenticola sp.]
TNHDRMKPCRDATLPAWIIRAQRELANSDTNEEPQGGEELYCLCRGPHRGQFMIQCDTCEEWFHGACVNVDEEEAKDIDQYVCPRCDVGAQSP